MACNFYLDKILGLYAPDPRFAGTSPIPQYSPNKNFTTVHIKLEIDLNIEKKTLDGKCSTILRSINGESVVKFDAINFQNVSVKDAKGKPLKHSYDNSIIEVNVGKIDQGKEVMVIIGYKIKEPALGVYFIGPDKFYPKKPVHVWSHSETEDGRHWFPSQDAPGNKSTSEIIISVPANFTAVSNGALLKVIENRKEKTRTFHWKMSKPHSTYLVSFAVGEFSEVKDNWKGVPVLYYCTKGREDEIKRAFGKTPDMIDFFSGKIGVKYPYEKYAQVAVADFIFGGMEHTTCTTQTDDVLHDDLAHEEAHRLSDGLCAHELAHQWFGDFLTCKDWSHAWLNESFATYFDALYVEKDKGADEFAYEMYQNAKDIFSEDKEKYRRPIVTNLYKRSNDLFDRHLYQKGACTLHMLRVMLGDKLWWKSINNYVNKNKNSSVETIDLINAIEESTGQNMRKFFDQWIFTSGFPEYKILYHWDDKTKEAVVRLSQIQQDGQMYSVRMDFEFITKNGIKKFSEQIEQKDQQFRYKLDSEPLLFVADPENSILKKMEIVKPRSMWIYQLNFASNPVIRIRAAEELVKSGANKDAEELGKALLKEKFWGAQVEIATLLGQMKTEKSTTALINALELKHPLVKRAVVAAIGEAKDARAVSELKKHLDDKSGYTVRSEVCRALGKSGDKSSEVLLKEMLEKESWLDMIKTGAMSGLYQLTDDITIPIKYSKPGYAKRTRLTAIAILGLAGKGRKDILDALIELTEDKYTLVQIAAAQSLAAIGDERAIPALEKLTKGDRDGRLKRTAEDAIKALYPWLDTDLETYRASEEIKKRLDKSAREKKLIK